jgi:catechol 2,3-dioxygenase-like lactoylglutathione lyase family enzyme
MAALFNRIIPILFVSDLEAERDFYVRLGFHVTYEGPEYPYFLALGHGPVEFGIERKAGFRSDLAVRRRGHQRCPAAARRGRSAV